MKKKWSERVGFFFLSLSGMLVIFILGVILFDIISKGGGSISWDFLTRPPQQGMTEGGIFPAILGTFLVSVITVLFAVPFGMFAAIYLHEYARPGKMTRLIRLSHPQPLGCPVDCLWSVWRRPLCPDDEVWNLCPLRGSYPRTPHPSMDHHGLRGGAKNRSQILP